MALVISVVWVQSLTDSTTRRAKQKTKKTRNIRTDIVLQKKKIILREFPGGLAIKNGALLLLCHGYNPWPRNFYIPWADAAKKNQKSIRKLSEFLKAHF